ncbi:phosphotransferase [Streptomyces achromogenes]
MSATAGTAAGETGSRQLRDFGTALLHTVVSRSPDGGYTWRRENGPAAPTPFVPADGGLHRLVAGLEPRTTVRWSVGAPDGAARLYRVRGPESLAGRLLREGPDQDTAATVRGLGQALRELHDTAVPADTGAGEGPRGLRRLTDWLDGRAPSPRAAYAESLLRPALGGERLAVLRGLAERMRGGDGADVRLCHGAAALGSLVPAESGTGVRGAADMLIGEDVCLAPWQFDVGWTLGELVELMWYRNDRHPAWSGMAEALFEGYGRDLADAWQRHAALRVLLHLHDYTAYVGWDRAAFDRYTGFVKFLLDL